MIYYLRTFDSHFMYCTEGRSWTVLDGLTRLVPELRHVVVGQLYVGITQGLHVVHEATNATLLLQLINQGLSRLYSPLLQICKRRKKSREGIKRFLYRNLCRRYLCSSYTTCIRRWEIHVPYVKIHSHK